MSNLDCEGLTPKPRSEGLTPKPRSVSKAMINRSQIFMFMLFVCVFTGCLSRNKIIFCGYETPKYDGNMGYVRNIYSMILDQQTVNNIIEDVNSLKKNDSSEFLSTGPIIVMLFIIDEKSTETERIYWISENRISGVEDSLSYIRQGEKAVRPIVSSTDVQVRLNILKAVRNSIDMPLIPQCYKIRKDDIEVHISSDQGLRNKYKQVIDDSIELLK